MLIIPTLLGIITLNFFIIQLSPGGPVEQLINKIEDSSITGQETITQKHDSLYRGDKGLDNKAVEEIKKLYGFDKPIYERYLLLLKQYLTFDLGKSYFRDISVVDLIIEKMPVSISLGVFSTLIIYLIGIPLGIFKARADGSRFDVVSSILIVVANSIPVFLFGIILILFFASGVYFDWFPLKGLVGPDFEELGFFGKIGDYIHHIFLPVITISLGGFATLVLLVKNSFIEEFHKYYVTYARIKGVSESRVLYRHVFRNAMLLVIASFPAVFLGMFFTGSFLVEVIFSLDGLGLLGYDSLIYRDYPTVFGSLYVFTLLGLVLAIISDLIYVLVDPRIHFDK